jgi:putative DNA primase/helicase
MHRQVPDVATATGSDDGVGPTDKEAVREIFDCAAYIELVHGAEHLGEGRYTCPWRGNEHELNPAFAVKPAKWFDHHDSVGGDCFALIMKLRDCDFRAALAEADAFVKANPAPRPKPMANSYSAWMQPPSEKTVQAMALWNECVPDSGRIADYLRFRGLSGVVPDGVRYHPRLPYHHSTEDDGSSPVQHLPAMVARVCGSDGSDVGVHRTYLDPEGQGKADVTAPKKMLGPVNGSSVHLDRFDKLDARLAVVEGIETGTAVHEATGLPVWAALSTGGMKSLELPSHDLLQLYVFADNDANGSGQDAAHALAEQHAEKGRVSVYILVPPKANTDWLDVLNSDGRDALQRAVDEAVEYAPAPKDGNSGIADIDSPIPLPPGVAYISPVPRCRPRRSEQPATASTGDVHNGQAGASSPGDERKEDAMAPRPDAVGNALPMLLLPAPKSPVHTKISDCAAALGRLMAPRGRYFCRAGVPVRVERRDGYTVLDDLKVLALPSEAEGVARLCCAVKAGDDVVNTATVMSKQQAELLLAAPAFRGALPEIRVLAQAPVLVAHADRSLTAVRGYDPESGILVTGGAVEDLPIEEAVGMLNDVLADFLFASGGDRARALAALITPALVQGGLLDGRAPMDVLEANDSQAGKGYLVRLRAAIYNDIPSTVTRSRGGVGGPEESFASLLLFGRRFISFDNLRGKADSEGIESALTEERYTARVPHRAAAEVDLRRVSLSLTSNRAEMTVDLANRSSPIRILKQPEDYHFREYPEGDLLAHVRANQGRFLGAVFAVVKHWHAQSCPGTDETRHSFHAWARSLDWIVQNVFNATPLCDGLPGARTRMADTNLTWMREACLVLARQGKADRWLTASDIVEALGSAGEPLPGMPVGGDQSNPEVRTQVLTAAGRMLGQAFERHGRPAGELSVINLDTMNLSRRTERDTAKGRDIKTYMLTIASDNSNTAVNRPTACSDAAFVGGTSASAASANPQVAGGDAGTATTASGQDDYRLDLF